MKIKQKVALYKKNCKWKTGLIGQANWSKVVCLTADCNAGLLKADFHLYVEYYSTLILLKLHATIQNRKGKLMWIIFVYMFFKTNYIWILLQDIMFHIQVKIGLYIMSPT